MSKLMVPIERSCYKDQTSKIWKPHQLPFKRYGQCYSFLRTGVHMDRPKAICHPLIFRYRGIKINIFTYNSFLIFKMIKAASVTSISLEYYWAVLNVVSNVGINWRNSGLCGCISHQQNDEYYNIDKYSSDYLVCHSIWTI
jgi:hypothetical protein